MLIERVNPAGSYQTHDVQRAVVPTCALAELHQLWNAKEFSRFDGLRDANEILGHHAAGAEIQMADFAVADLSFRKTDGEARRLEQRTRRALPQPVPHRRAPQLDRVALPTRLGPRPRRVALSARAEAPAVENDEHYRAGGPRRARATARCHIEGDAS